MTEKDGLTFEQLKKVTDFDGLLKYYHENVKESVNKNFPLNHMGIELHIAPTKPMSPDFKYHLIVRFPYGSNRNRNRDYLSVMGDTIEGALSKMQVELSSYFLGA